MARGLTFGQIGVTEAMIATYADAIWEMSNNVQVRRGDPVRKLEFERIEAERADLGMSDAQIARAIGLTRDQVLVIRLLTEVRRFRRRSYQRLYELGRGHRFNVERYLPHEARGGYTPEALALRDTMRFPPRLVSRYIAEGLWADDTLTGWLASRAARSHRRAAVKDQQEEIGYKELLARVERFAAGLHALGLGRGDVVSVQLPNAAEFLIAYLAIARLGAVMATVPMSSRTGELKALLAHARARALICPSRIKDYEAAAAALALKVERPALAHVIVLGDPPSGASSYADVLAHHGKVPEDIAPAPADPFLLLYPSAACASLKAVPHTYQAVLGNARLGAPEHRITGDDILLSAAPYSCPFGLYSVHLAMSVGATSLLLPTFTPADCSLAIASGRPTVLFAAPAHLAAMLEAGLLDTTDLSSVRLVIACGRACPPDLARALAATLAHGSFARLWGMAETQAALYTRPDDPVELAAVSAGRPSPGTEVRIADADGVALGPSAEGELQVRGSLLFPRYFDNEEANAAAFAADGWFRTGDLASRDDGGNVRITGRIPPARA